jgi:hypothetical protein
VVCLLATSIGMIVRPRLRLIGETINKIATYFEMWLHFMEPHGGFVVYFSCMVELVKKVIFIVLSDSYQD